MSVRQTPAVGFTVGVCASDSARNLGGLIQTIQDETPPPGLALARIVVVASGCPPSVLSEVEGLAREDHRVLVLGEEQRKGKIEAINQIIRHNEGVYLVLVNSDATPARGSISTLLQEIHSGGDIGSVSALPVLPSRDSTTQKVLELMWTAHNVSAAELNHAGLSNHNCDELMVVRSNLLSELPTDVVNDGAYIGGMVYSKGYRIIFAKGSRVGIDTPTRISDLVQQRRRILFGHAQVWRNLGRAPRTVESLMLTNPRLAMRLLGKVLASRPDLVAVLPLALVTEATSGVLSILDRALSPRRHVVWTRYGGPSNAQ